MMYSCKKATEIIEKKSIDKLSFYQAIQLKLHLFICKTCQSYQKHSLLLDKYFTKSNEINHAQLNNQQLKDKVLQKLNI